jgi:hypothetical protein
MQARPAQRKRVFFVFVKINRQADFYRTAIIIFHLQREMKNEMLTKEKDLAELGNLSNYVSINTTLSTR